MDARSLEGRRFLMVVAPTEFQDQELLEPKGIFESHGARVEVASTTPAARGELGTELVPDVVMAASELATAATGPGPYDAIVVVGGRGAPASLWEHGVLHALLRLARAEGAVIGATSLATPVLARAGLLQGVHATVFGLPHAKHELLRGGALYVDEPIVADQGVITASGAQAARAFAEAMARAVAERPPHPAP